MTYELHRLGKSWQAIGTRRFTWFSRTYSAIGATADRAIASVDRKMAAVKCGLCGDSGVIYDNLLNTGSLCRCKPPHLRARKRR